MPDDLIQITKCSSSGFIHCYTAVLTLCLYFVFFYASVDKFNSLIGIYIVVWNNSNESLKNAFAI